MPSRVLKFKTPISVFLDSYPQNHLVTSNLALKTFGCTSFVYLPSLQTTKLSPRAIKCLFLRYCPTKKGYKCYNPLDILEPKIPSNSSLEPNMSSSSSLEPNMSSNFSLELNLPNTSSLSPDIHPNLPNTIELNQPIVSPRNEWIKANSHLEEPISELHVYSRKKNKTQEV